MKLKYTFYLKSGKVFEAYVEISLEEFYKITQVIKQSFQEGVDGVITLSQSVIQQSVIRLSDCSVVDWEEIE